MALDFPANPTNGQAYGSYIYNSTIGAWQSKEDPATVAVTSTTAPASANNGDIWYNTNTGVSYVYYNDGTSAQWVEIVSSAVPSLNNKANVDSPTFTTSVTGPYFHATSNGAGTNFKVGDDVWIGDVNLANTMSIRGVSNAANAYIQFGSGDNTVLGRAGTGALTYGGNTVWHAGNDGTGSGLDADLLDGQHGSVYSPAGMVSQFAGSTAPTGWLLCDGAAVSRTTYATLFTAIGTVYGTGDGSTTFNIPNLQGRVPVGKNAGTFNALGATGGAETVTLTEAQMPSHTHIQNAHNHTQDAHNHSINDPGHSHGDNADFTIGLLSGAGVSGIPNGYSSWGGYGSAHWYTIYGAYTGISNNSTTATNQATTATNQSTGGGGAHNNLQPYIVMNYIIKV